MVLTTLLDFCLKAVGGVLGGVVMPSTSTLASISTFLHYLSIGLYFVDANVFFAVIGTVVTCLVAQFGFAVGIFVLRKIPFVNMS